MRILCTGFRDQITLNRIEEPTFGFFEAKNLQKELLLMILTFGYEIIIKLRPSWIWQIWWPQLIPASMQSKMNLVGSGLHNYVTNFKLVNKSS